MKKDLLDEKYMKIAVSLAKKGIGKTSPNPAVGAVLVKNGKVIAADYHKKAGSMHAETLAILKAGNKARGATLYVTLEACTHSGKTPPCTNAIIQRGIKRAVFAVRDPNPINYGRGIAALRRAGIETKCGVLRNEATDLNRPFTKFMKRHLPYITVKMAQSVDGKIADAKGCSRWISSAASRRLVHKLRSQNDAVMVGINTLRKDNPRLTNRTYGRIKRQPLRIILDTNLRTPLRSSILNDIKNNGKVLIVGGKGASLKKKLSIEKKGAKVILLPKKNNRINLHLLLKYLTGMNVMSVLCEGGSELVSSLITEKLADEIFFFISPRIIGGRRSLASCDGLPGSLRKSITLKKPDIERVGQDFLIRGYL